MDTKNFDILSEEKRNAVLNAAFTCFGKDGYKKTAMSEIAVTACVSKAALFHYFGTKKDLYFYLFRFSCNEILSKTNSGTEDFFECVEISIRIKMDVIDKYPSMFDFLNTLVCEDDTSIITELQTAHEDEINKWIERLIANVDWNRFLPGINSEEALNVVNWVSDGYIKTYAGNKDREIMLGELRRYFDLIKRAVYKGEYL